MEFFEHVDLKQKVAFLVAMGFLCRVDGEFADTEKEFFLDLAKLYMVPKDHTKEALKKRTEEETLAIVKSDITDPGLGLVLIREMLYLGYEDGNLTEAEIGFISKVAEKLGVPFAKVEEISAWVIKGIEWEEEGIRLFSDFSGSEKLSSDENDDIF